MHNAEKEFGKEINDAMSEQLIMLPFLFSEAIQDFFYFALENELLIRGAISEGSLFTDEDEKVYMGPAAIDAAEIYEMAEWIGIICTTSTSFSILEKQKYLENRIKQKLEDVDSYYFFDDINNYIPYTVSLKQKDNSSKNIETDLMVLDWPAYFFKKNQSDVIGICKIFHGNHIPIKDKTKYDNTINFFKKRTDIFKQEKERNEALDFKRDTDNLFFQLETRNLPGKINGPIQSNNAKF
ncbi:MAG: hypothetical protein KBC24_05470 [Caldisericia bacterium]|nr:hypothetical protein [Caldisericia bacterium]